ncbi:hypothetical protein D9M72_599600 [compost metagenome]
MGLCALPQAAAPSPRLADFGDQVWIGFQGFEDMKPEPVMAFAIEVPGFERALGRGGHGVAAVKLHCKFHSRRHRDVMLRIRLG